MISWNKPDRVATVLVFGLIGDDRLMGLDLASRTTSCISGCDASNFARTAARSSFRRSLCFLSSLAAL